MSKLALIAAALAGYAVLAGCRKAGPFRWQQHELGGRGRVSVPKDWANRGVRMEGASWQGFEFVKTQSWWIGAGDPLEVRAWIALGSPDASAAQMDDAMKAVFRAVQDDTRRFDEFGSYKNGSRETWISEGNYQISPNHDPEKVIFLRAVDHERRAAIAMRVYTRKIPHEKLKKITQELWSSLGSPAAKNSF